MTIVLLLAQKTATVLIGLTIAAWLGIAAARAEVAVDLELVLAVDVSWSMDREEQELQRNGYVQAFKDPALIKAIQGGVHGRIAVTYVEWAGPALQRVVMPWTLIEDPGSAHDFANTLATRPINRWQMTSISGALDYSAALFGAAAFRGLRRVIDVSGDGPNNAGAPGGVVPVRDRLVAGGIVINGLPILIRPSAFGSTFDIPDLDIYYQDCVVGGPGSFVIPIRHAEEFLTATRQKLLIEISDLANTPRIQFAQAEGARGASDCMVGERRRRDWDWPR